MFDATASAITAYYELPALADGATAAPNHNQTGDRLLLSAVVVQQTTTTTGTTTTTTTAPTITGLRQARRTWREGTRPATIARAATGTVFTFDLTAAARVTVTFTGKVAGRRVGGRCVAPTRANRHRSSCARTVSPGTAVVRRPRRGERRELRRAGGTPPAPARPVHRPLHREQRPRPGNSRRAHVHDRRLTPARVMTRRTPGRRDRETIGHVRKRRRSQQPPR